MLRRLSSAAAARRLATPSSGVRPSHSTISCSVKRSPLFAVPRCYFSTSKQNRVAVVLSGCGVFDGTEIQEAVSCLVHLSRKNCKIACFAPDIDQRQVINHRNGEEDENDSRNVLEESARIARGDISPLNALDVESFDAVVFPGGFGAAKNLSTFAFDGARCTVNDEVEDVIKNFHKNGKPIGLCCISPILAAKVLGDKKISITLGHEKEENGKWPYASSVEAVKEMGATHVVKDVVDAHIDKNNKIVTAPAYMYAARPHEVFDSVGKMIEGIFSLIK